MSFLSVNASTLPVVPTEKNKLLAPPAPMPLRKCDMPSERSFGSVSATAFPVSLIAYRWAPAMAGSLLRMESRNSLRVSSLKLSLLSAKRSPTRTSGSSGMAPFIISSSFFSMPGAALLIIASVYFVE